MDEGERRQFMTVLLDNVQIYEERDVYTKDRKKTGKTCTRGEQGSLLEDEFHLWVMVWIKNPKTGKYLVSQRSADKDTDPLKWETVVGHSISGDTSLDAALREVFEEVGITLQREKATVLATKVAFAYDGCRHNWIRRGNPMPLKEK